MDVDVNSVDVHKLTIYRLALNDQLSAWFYILFVSWVIFVASVVSLAANYYRWHRPLWTFSNVTPKPRKKVQFDRNSYVEQRDDE